MSGPGSGRHSAGTTGAAGRAAAGGATGSPAPVSRRGTAGTEGGAPLPPLPPHTTLRRLPLLRGQKRGTTVREHVGVLRCPLKPDVRAALSARQKTLPHCPSHRFCPHSSNTSWITRLKG